MSVFLQSLLGIISAHLVSAIIVLVAIVALVWGLYRVAGVLDSARAIVKMFLPDKFEAVYEALVIAAQAASDGSLSTAEAKDLARKGFDAALKAANVSLTDVEKEQAYNILDWLIEQIIKDPAAAAKALSAL
jgi:hypothetical protein